MKKRYKIIGLVFGLLLSLSMIASGVVIAAYPSGGFPLDGTITLTITGIPTPTPTVSLSGETIRWSLGPVTAGNWVSKNWTLPLSRDSSGTSTFTFTNTYGVPKVVTPTCTIGGGFSGVTATWTGLSGGSVTVPAGGTAVITLTITTSASASGSDSITFSMTVA